MKANISPGFQLILSVEICGKTTTNMPLISFLKGQLKSNVYFVEISPVKGRDQGWISALSGQLIIWISRF